MDPVALAAGFEKYGGWFAFALSLVAIVWLANKLMTKHDAHLKDMRELIEETTRCIANCTQQMATASMTDASLIASREQMTRSLDVLAAKVEQTERTLRDVYEHRGRR